MFMRVMLHGLFVCGLGLTVATSALNKAEPKPITEDTVRLYYDDQELVDVINELAARRGVNIVLPIGQAAIQSKLTFHMEKRVTLKEAWELLYKILDVAGYALVERTSGSFAVVRKSATATKGDLPVYMDVDPENLPDTDEYIRYLYFMTNIKLKSQGGPGELQAVLRDMLPQVPLTSFALDPASNALLIIAKASDVKSVMRIIKILEKTTYKERMEFIKLSHVTASAVATIFNNKTDGILKTPTQPRSYGVANKKPSEATYFSKFVKIIPDHRLNALVVVGRETAVDRVKDFIQKYIDVPLESGSSVLHVYDLLYLNAAEFAPVLENITKGTAVGGTGQVETGAGTAAGVERYFQGVKVRADSSPEEASSEDDEEGGTGGKYRGSNKIVVAAKNDDWKRIKSLIEELDTPQPQVILQVLVADFTLEDVHLIGSMLRNPEKWGFPKGFAAQSAQLNTPILDSADNPTTLAADLLSNYYKTDDADVSLASTLESNSTLVSLNDCTNCWTWAVLQFLNTIEYRKVLSLPHIIAVNNKKAEIVIGESRLLRDAAVGNQGGSVSATNKWIDANLKINLVPRIAFGEHAERVTLDIKVEIDDFTSDAIDEGNKIIRSFRTVSIVKSGEVIALGGLARSTDTEGIRQWPILGQIPILGYLFKRRIQTKPQESLTVFIKSTIVQPKLRGGMGKYTQDYIKLTKSYTKEGALFESLKDPITRWFFRKNNDINTAVDDFVSRDEITSKALEYDAIIEATEEAAVAQGKDSQAITTPALGRKEVFANTSAGNKKKVSKAKRKKSKRSLALASKRGRPRPLFMNDKLETLLADQDDPFVS